MTPLLFALACAHTPEAPVIDLTQPPIVAEAPRFTPPTPNEHTLSNGIKAWVVERPDLPLVSLRVVVPGGSASDPKDAWGTASLADEMLSQGSGSRDATEFAREVEQLALSLDSQTTGSATLIALDTQAKTLPRGIELLTDMVFEPHFHEDDFKRVRDIRVGQLTEANDDATTVASWVLDQQYFGDGHPLAHPVEGTLGSMNSIQSSDLKRSWENRFLHTNGLSIVVAGDVKTESILALLETAFGKWDPSLATPKAPIPAPAEPVGDDRMFFVNKPGTSQTSLKVIMPAPNSTHELSESAELGAIVLGGTFTSRLNRVLREEKGYTYGARARYTGKPTYGTLVASTNVQNDVAAPALSDLMRLLTEYQNGISGDELTKAQSAWHTRAVASMESRSSVASNFAAIVGQGLPASTIADELAKAKAATLVTVNKAIESSNVSNAIVVIAGDMDVIQAPIQEAFPDQGRLVEPTK